MFAYLRYFSAISLVIVIIFSVMVGFYFRSSASNDLKMFVEKGSITMVQGYHNTIWQKYRPLFRKLATVDMREWANDPEFLEFSRESFKYFEGMSIGKITVYTPQLKRFIATDQSEIIQYPENPLVKKLSGGNQDDDNNTVFAHARAGDIYSRLIGDGAFKKPDGSLQRGALVQTVVPIISDEYTPVLAGLDRSKYVEAIVEVYYDITPQWNHLYMFQFIGTGGILIIFFLIISALYYTSNRAESIIAKKHEENLELTAAKAKAESESQNKSQFMANVSHELRTPLNAIIGFSEMMKNEVYGNLGNEQYLDYAKDIHASGEHLLSLINDILDYSKAEAGKLELEVLEVDATKIFKSCVRFVSPRAENAGVNLVEQFPEERVIMHTDGKRLKQILLNLLSNAVKFTPNGGEVKLAVMFGLNNESVVVVVKDTGIGMAKKDIAKAMSVFGQVDSELSRKYEGTGLGLPLTRKLVTLLGGTFEIDSEPNMGTEITIQLPLRLEHKQKPQDKEEQQQAGEESA